MKHNLEIPCKHCNEKTRARDLDRHENVECMYRNIPCPREDCGEMVQAHNLKDHMSYSCPSKMYHHRCWLIKRGRKRKNYARPWGIEIPLHGSDDDDSSVEYDHSRPSTTTTSIGKSSLSRPTTGNKPNSGRVTSPTARPPGSP